jgi:hypothetical protein
MRIRPHILLSALVSFAIAACASRPTHVYPLLQPPAETERALTCEQLDDDILRSDAVRWSMRSEGMKVRTSTANAGLILANIPMLAIGVLPASFPDLGRQARVNAADVRIVGLLEIKSGKGCPAQSTADPALSDLDVLRQLQGSDADWKARRISEKTAIANRARLLDGLRGPRAIQASGSQAGLPAH